MTGNKAIAGVYKTHIAAEAAVMELQKAGLDMKTLSVAGKVYHSDEHVVAYYNTGDRMMAWGKIGGFWDGLWGLLSGAGFFFVPGLGPIAVAGPLGSSIVKALEGAVIVGNLGAVGAGLFSIGIPKDSAIKYETMLKADRFIVICHGATGVVEKARSILEYTEATEVNIHDGDGQTSSVILFCKKD
ncbi:MAG: permease [Pseudomonadota bacterium]